MKAELMLAAALGAAVLSGCGSTENTGYGPSDAAPSAEEADEGVLENKFASQVMDLGTIDGFEPRDYFFSAFRMRQCYLADGSSSECNNAKAKVRGIMRGLDARCYLAGDGKSCTRLGEMIDDFYDDQQYYWLYKQAMEIPVNAPVNTYEFGKEIDPFQAWLDLPSVQLSDHYFEYSKIQRKDVPIVEYRTIISKKACYAKDPDPSACARYALHEVQAADVISQLERGYRLGDPLAANLLFQIYGGIGNASRPFSTPEGKYLRQSKDLAKSWFYLKETCRLSGTPELCNGITSKNVWNYKKKLGDFKWVYPSWGMDEFFARGRKPWLTKEPYGAKLHVPYDFWQGVCLLWDRPGEDCW